MGRAWTVRAAGEIVSQAQSPLRWWMGYKPERPPTCCAPGASWSFRLFRYNDHWNASLGTFRAAARLYASFAASVLFAKGDGAKVKKPNPVSLPEGGC